MEDLLPLVDFSKVRKKKKVLEKFEDPDPDDLGEVSLTKKRKKKEKKNIGDEESKENTVTNLIEDGYPYEFLLSRVYKIIKEKNPESSNEKGSFKIPPPTVTPAGKSRVCWTNFKEFPKVFNRPVEHLFQYVLVELGVEGTIGGEDQVNIKARTTTKDIEKVLIKYINDYVKCPNCKSFKTTIQKDQSTRLMQIHCENCKSQKTIQNLKSKVKTGKK